MRVVDKISVVFVSSLFTYVTINSAIKTADHLIWKPIVYRTDRRLELLSGRELCTLKLFRPDIFQHLIDCVIWIKELMLTFDA